MASLKSIKRNLSINQVKKLVESLAGRVLALEAFNGMLMERMKKANEMLDKAPQPVNPDNQYEIKYVEPTVTNESQSEGK